MKFWPSYSQTQPLNFLIHVRFGSSLQCMTTVSETVILKQTMKFHYSGTAIVFRVPN